MKLQAVTICINYADYLECIIENRWHFDRWIIITVPEDRATRELCERHGLEWIDSSILSADGSDFHAVTNKGQVLNEGLEKLDADAWALILDADVLLPRHFRERVNAMPLESGCLYATAGRKLCESREQFEMARHCEPWDRLVSRHSQALGYFNLFHVGTVPNRYPDRPADDFGSHDDYLFTTSFTPEQRRILPFTAIHTGARAINWGGRISGSFANRSNESNHRQEITALASDGTGKRAAVVGYFPGGRWRDLTSGYDEVCLVDHYAIHCDSGSSLVNADRGVLREAIGRAVGSEEKYRFLGAHTAEVLATISDGSIDFLYFAGESEPETLCRSWGLWRPKLSSDAIVCGDIYGLPYWPDATYTVSLLCGAPDGVTSGGMWWKKASRIPERAHVASLPDGEAVVFVNSGKDQLESLLLSIHAARKHWTGTLQVWHHGEENESLRLGCARLGVDLVHMAEEDGELDELLETCSILSPFPRALFLVPGHVAVASLQAAFEERAGAVDAFRGEPRRVSNRRFASGRPVWDRFTFAVAQTYQGAPDEGVIVACQGEPEEWTEHAWIVWCDVQAEAALNAASTIQVPLETTIVSIVTEEDAGDFQRNWLSWRFPTGTPILLILAGINPEEFWLPGLPESARVVPLTSKQASDVPWILNFIADRVSTKRTIILHPTAAALPGARLFDGESWREREVWLHASDAAGLEFDATGNDFVSRALFAFCPSELLRVAATSIGKKNCALESLPLVFRKLAAEAGKADLSKLGWRFTPATLLATSDSHRQQTPAIIRRKNGTLQLADDVAVISLPERADRRERITEMFEKEKVSFRFVDGVRVSKEEIDPLEVSEVGRNNFKLVGGWEKYLCGMAGCRRAHLGILDNARRHGLKTLLLIEDDMHLVDGWLERLIPAMSELPPGWMQLYLSAADFRKSEPFSKNLHRIHGSYQTTAILYSAVGIEAAYQCLKRSRSEIDHWMGRHLHPFGNSYAVRPGIAYQKGGVSDIMSFDRGVTA